jgi:lysozyme family protein
MKWWQVFLDGLGLWTPPPPTNSLNTRASAALPCAPEPARPVPPGRQPVPGVYDLSLKQVEPLFKEEPTGLNKPDRFSLCLPLILAHEGGYVDHPADPGGATNLGITLATLSAWRGATVTKADVRALTQKEAGAIYRARYWNAVRGDDLPPGLDLAMFDYAVNSGVGRAAKDLQGLVGAVQDGAIGAKTLAALDGMPAAHLVTRLCDTRLAFLRGLKTWPTFGKGWARRVEETRAAALAGVAG